MSDNKIIDSDYDISNGEENHFNLQECHNMTKELEEELELCKTDQNDIRSKLQTLCDESKADSNAMRNFFLQWEGCCNKMCYDKDVQNEAMQDEEITNLKMQIALLEKEQNSARLLLQMNSIEALRVDQIERDNIKLYKEQLEIKQLYSEAIKACESKLIKIKDEFAKQQSLWETSKETIETLKKEKYEMENNLRDLERKANWKEKNNLEMIQLLTKELSEAKAQIEKLNALNLDSEKELCESKKTVNHVTAKNEETQCKMAETLDLIEWVVKEKSLTFEREAEIMERNSKLEMELAHSAEVHTAKMQEEIAKLKDVHEHNVKKYLLEIKELKLKLEEKEMLLNQSERNNSLMEMELDKLRKYTEDLLEKSTTKILENLPLKSNSDQIFKHADHEWNLCNMCKFQHNFELKQQEEITNLKENLAISNDKLQQIQQQNPNLRVKLDEERTEDVIKRCNHLESQLIKATNDKESLATELKSLQTLIDYEIRKRDHERYMLENKIRELEMNLQKETYTNKRIENLDEKWPSLLNENLKKQEKSVKKVKRLKECIAKCEERNKLLVKEAQLSNCRAERFYKFYKAIYSRLKEQNEKVCTLKTKNDELQKLLSLTNERNMYLRELCTPNIESSETAKIC